MPLFSFVVSAYNVEQTIERCLRCLQHQTLRDFEVVVVDDASTDTTKEKIQAIMNEDQRFRLLAKRRNEGLHSARRSGVALTHGQYVVFVDGDDELEPTAVEMLSSFGEEREFDILRFGRTVIPENGVSFQDAKLEERAFNAVYREKTGRDIPRTIYGDAQPFRQTWSMIDCVFKGDYVREIFDSMTSERLGGMEDSYEFFMLAINAKTMLGISEYHALRYHYGSGVSGTGIEPLSQFIKVQNEMASSARALVRAAESTDDAEWKRCSQWYWITALGIVGRIWSGRLTAANQIKAFDALRMAWGDENAAFIVLEPLVPRAQWLWDSGNYPPSDDEYNRWRSLLDQLELTSVENEVIVVKIQRFRELQADIEQREHDRRVQEEEERAKKEEQARRAQLEQQRAEEMERLRQQELEESRRLFPAGSAPRVILDAVLPEKSGARMIARKIANCILRR